MKFSREITLDKNNFSGWKLDQNFYNKRVTKNYFPSFFKRNKCIAITLNAHINYSKKITAKILQTKNSCPLKLT